MPNVLAFFFFFDGLKPFFLNFTLAKQGITTKNKKKKRPKAWLREIFEFFVTKTGTTFSVLQ
jgi:hypothetical protein